MSEFFDTYLNIGKIAVSKREWKRQAARVESLPDDYQYVYEKITHYLFSCGLTDVKMIYGLIDLFEGGAAEGRRVLEITGDDVAAFCDELIRNAKTYTQSWRENLNRDIAKKLKWEASK
jgi:DNA-binding ferritin-like protein (Dps family)